MYIFIMKNIFNDGMVVCPYNLSSWVVEEKASDIENQPQIGSEFESRQGYMRYWLKKIREGLGRCSVSKVLAMQAGGAEFDPAEPL